MNFVITKEMVAAGMNCKSNWLGDIYRAMRNLEPANEIKTSIIKACKEGLNGGIAEMEDALNSIMDLVAGDK